MYKFMYNYIWMLILSSPLQDPYGWLVNLINKVGTALYVFVHSSSYKLCDHIFLHAEYCILHNTSTNQRL